MVEYKIVFAGTMGAGKTTAITAVSEIPVTSTDVFNNAREEFNKGTTTAAMDYGEVTLAGDEKLRLYGTPGQERFDFMWPILGRGALGVVILVDGSRPDPCADVVRYATAFKECIEAGAAVVGIGRDPSHELIERCGQALGERGFLLPVFAVDVREREDVLLLLDTLFGQLEASQAASLALTQ